MASGWAELATVQGERVLRLKARREVKKHWRVPTLLLDATPRVELLRHIWPDVTVVADVRAQAPHQHVRQVTDRGFALSMLDVEGARDAAETKHRMRSLRRVHAIMCREARRYWPGLVLVVSQERIERQFAQGRLGPLPQNVQLAHHNGVRGLDRWRDVRAMILIGRTLPSHIDLVRMAEALTGAAILADPYQRGDAWREMADGTTKLCEAWQHPHPIVEALRWSACEAEAAQLIGRVRGVNRGTDNPVDVLALVDVPLPLPVGELVSEAAVAPTPADQMAAAGGIVLENAADAAAVYPDLWPKHGAARQAFLRSRSATFSYEESSIRECREPPPGMQRIYYQREGAGRSRCVAMFDPEVHPDPVPRLADVLGPFAFCAPPRTVRLAGIAANLTIGVPMLRAA